LLPNGDEDRERRLRDNKVKKERERGGKRET
jgi:hypothetical protein